MRLEPISTSLHGLGTALLLTNQKAQRMFWFSMFLALMVLFVVAEYGLFKQYFAYEVRTNLAFSFNEVPFPAVTICNINGYKASEFGKVPQLISANLAYNQLVKKKFGSAQGSNMVQESKRKKRQSCPTGYDLHADACYKRLAVKLSQENAEIACQADHSDAHIPAFPNQGTFDGFRDWLNAKGLANVWVFIEGTDQLKVGDWIVRDHKTKESCLMPFEKWNVGPLNDQAGTEHCLVTMGGVEMYDAPCSYEYDLVCQVPLFAVLCPEVVHCKNLTIPFGSVVYSNDTLLPGVTATVTCTDTTFMHGSSTLTCGDDLNWDKDIPVCYESCAIVKNKCLATPYGGVRFAKNHRCISRQGGGTFAYAHNFCQSPPIDGRMAGFRTKDDVDAITDIAVSKFGINLPDGVWRTALKRPNASSSAFSHYYYYDTATTIAEPHSTLADSPLAIYNADPAAANVACVLLRLINSKFVLHGFGDCNANWEFFCEKDMPCAEECPSPPFRNAVFSYSATPVYPGVQATVKCKPGFYMDDQGLNRGTVTCGSDYTWKGTIPECLPLCTNQEGACSNLPTTFTSMMFNSTCLAMHTVGVTWNVAADACQGQGMRLATVDSMEEYNGLMDVMKKTPQWVSHWVACTDCHWWAGFKKETFEDHFLDNYRAYDTKADLSETYMMLKDSVLAGASLTTDPISSESMDASCVTVSLNTQKIPYAFSKRCGTKFFAFCSRDLRCRQNCPSFIIEHGNVTLNQADSLISSKATVTCDPGYWLNSTQANSAVYECESNGTHGIWNKPVEHCVSKYCPAGYDPGVDACYKSLGTLSTTYVGAEAACQSDNKDAHLSAFPNETIFNGFLDWLASTGNTQGSIFIEGDDIAREKKWMVYDYGINSSCSMPFRKWGPGEPSNSNGNEDCATIRAATYMNDVPCQGQLGVVCQIPLFSNICPITDCPNGYEQFNDACYKLLDKSGNYEQAEAACQADHEDAHLPAFPDENVYNEYILWAKDWKGSEVSYVEGSDALWEGKWTVRDHLTNNSCRLPFAKWWSDDPSGGTAENCLAMYGTSGMVDIKCDRTEKIVCQIAQFTRLCPVSECPPGYEQFNDACYKWLDKSGNFEQAEAACQADHEDAHLPVFPDENVYNGYILWTKYWKGSEVSFIEGSDALWEGKWTVRDHLTNNSCRMPFAKWLSGEPNGGGGENCAAVYRMNMHDIKCDRTEKIVCQIALFDSLCPVSDCPKGYEFAVDACYKLVGQGPGYQNSETACQDDNAKAHRPVIPSEASFDGFQTWLKNWHLDNANIFLEGTDSETEGSWVIHDYLINDTCKAPFTKWSSGQPDNYLQKEHCLSVGYGDLMNDRPCDYVTNVVYVCQVPLFKNVCPVTDPTKICCSAENWQLVTADLAMVEGLETSQECCQECSCTPSCEGFSFTPSSGECIMTSKFPNGGAGLTYSPGVITGTRYTGSSCPPSAVPTEKINTYVCEDQEVHVSTTAHSMISLTESSNYICCTADDWELITADQEPETNVNSSEECCSICGCSPTCGGYSYIPASKICLMTEHFPSGTDGLKYVPGTKSGTKKTATVCPPSPIPVQLLEPSICPVPITTLEITTKSSTKMKYDTTHSTKIVKRETSKIMESRTNILSTVTPAIPSSTTIVSSSHGTLPEILTKITTELKYDTTPWTKTGRSETVVDMIENRTKFQSTATTAFLSSMTSEITATVSDQQFIPVPPKICCAADNWKLKAHELEPVLGVASVGDCCQLCSCTASCVSFSYLASSGECLMTAVVPNGLQGLTYQFQWITGIVVTDPSCPPSPIPTTPYSTDVCPGQQIENDPPRPQATIEPIKSGIDNICCTGLNFKLNVHDLAPALDVSSPEECCQICRCTAGCDGFSYDPTAEECLMTTSFPAGGSGMTPANGIVSGVNVNGSVCPDSPAPTALIETRICSEFVTTLPETTRKDTTHLTNCDAILSSKIMRSETEKLTETSTKFRSTATTGKLAGVTSKIAATFLEQHVPAPTKICCTADNWQLKVHELEPALGVASVGACCQLCSCTASCVSFSYLASSGECLMTAVVPNGLQGLTFQFQWITGLVVTDSICPPSPIPTTLISTDVCSNQQKENDPPRPQATINPIISETDNICCTGLNFKINVHDLAPALDVASPEECCQICSCTAGCDGFSFDPTAEECLMTTSFPAGNTGMTPADGIVSGVNLNGSTCPDSPAPTMIIETKICPASQSSLTQQPSNEMPATSTEKSSSTSILGEAKISNKKCCIYDQVGIIGDMPPAINQSSYADCCNLCSCMHNCKGFAYYSNKQTCEFTMSLDISRLKMPEPDAVCGAVVDDECPPMYEAYATSIGKIESESCSEPNPKDEIAGEKVPIIGNPGESCSNACFRKGMACDLNLMKSTSTEQVKDLMMKQASQAKVSFEPWTAGLEHIPHCPFMNSVDVGICTDTNLIRPTCGAEPAENQKRFCTCTQFNSSFVGSQGDETCEQTCQRKQLSCRFDRIFRLSKEEIQREQAIALDKPQDEVQYQNIKFAWIEKYRCPSMQAPNFAFCFDVGHFEPKCNQGPYEIGQTSICECADIKSDNFDGFCNPLDNDCQNDGRCFKDVETRGSQVCICKPGYDGDKCEIATNACLENLCVHPSTCIDHHSHYTCECPPGKMGIYCETNSNDCEPFPCSEGDKCFDLLDGYKCISQAEVDAVEEQILKSILKDNENLGSLEEIEAKVMPHMSISMLNSYMTALLPYMLAGTADSVVQGVGYSLEDMLLGCFYEDRPCEMWTREAHPQYGNCYSFNHNVTNQYFVKRPGPKFGLIMQLNFDTQDYTNNIESSGIKVTFHRPGVKPNVDNDGHFVIPGFFNSFRINYVLQESLPLPYGGDDCIEDKSEVSPYFYDEKYSIASCESSYLQTQINRICNCTASQFAIAPNASRHLCSVKTSSVSCTETVIDQTAASKEMGHCLQACRNELFTTYNSLSKKRIPGGCNSKTQPARCKILSNIGVVEAFFSTVSMTHLWEVPKEEMAQTVAGMGGFTGLFVGASVISVIEFGYLLLFCCFG